MKIYCRMETGVGKTENEDRLLIGNTILAGGTYFCETSENTSPLMLAVADGVGGNKAGNVAAHMAVEGVCSMNIATGADEVLLARIIHGTNTRIIEKSNRDRAFYNMATTLSGVCHTDRRWFLFHVGNTRVYCWKEPYLTQITTDHSWAREMKMLGWTDDEIQASGRAAEINSCLGNGDPLVASKLQISDATLEIEEAQMLLFTTDGIHDYIPKEMLEFSFCSISDIALYLKQAMNFAREKGSTDDLSMMIVDFGQR